MENSKKNCLITPCFQLRGSLKFVSSPQCKYMNFIYPKSLFITWMVYLDPTYFPAPSWLVSSVDIALHRYRRGHGFKTHFFFFFFRSYFQLLVQQCSQLQGSLNFVSSPLCKYMNFIHPKSLPFAMFKIIQFRI